MNRIVPTFIIPTAALILAGCGRESEPSAAVATIPSSAAAQPATMQPSALRPDDRAVIEVALLHFLQDPEANTFGSRGDKTILLLDRTAERSGMIGPDQLKGEFKHEVLPKDAVRDMSERSGAAVSPDAKAWAELWPPGYTGDGTRAVVRFWFGPTAHGATGTYELERSKGSEWTVVRRKLAYYA